jgi:elongation factor Ts
MANVSAQDVKVLRDRTGAGMMDCKNALVEAEGDQEKAVEIIQKKGLAKAAKKAGAIAAEGVIHSYIHAGSRIGVLVEVNCETDFVARNDEFRGFVKDLCLQIAASNPAFVKREDIPASLVEKEKAIYLAQAKEMGKPEPAWAKIVEGKIEKFYQESCLLEQAFIKDPSVFIKDLLAQKIAKIGENISVRRFTRYQLGQE